MTKAELVTAIAIQTGYDKTTIMNIVEAGMECAKKTMASGENIYLRGFGSFVLKTRKQKIARNILEKTSIVVPEHHIASFKAAKEFAEAIR